MNDDEFLYYVASALLDPTSTDSVDNLTSFLIKHMDKVSAEYGKPLDDESYAYIQSSLKQMLEALLPFANADFYATYDFGDGAGEQNVPMYHIMTLIGGFMELIKHHLNYNVFYELAALDSYYIQDDLIGDVNGDKYIDVNDATLIQKYAVKKIEFDNEQFYAADVNNDGFVDVNDATDVQKYAVKKITEFTKKG